MIRTEISKTDLHSSRPWQVFAICEGLRIPCGSFKTKRAAQTAASEYA